MKCRNTKQSNIPPASPKIAAGISCHFLNVLAGRRSAPELRRYATRRGWAAFCRVRGQVSERPRQTRVRRLSCPTESTAELVALIGDGRSSKAMTFTFQWGDDGWRLDDCAVLRAGAEPCRAAAR